MTPPTLAILASCVLLITFASVGILQFRREHTTTSFFLNDRKLDKRAIRNTFSGAAISVSTVLVFFFTIGLSFGWQILLSPLTLAIGVVVFRYAVLPQLLTRGFIQTDPGNPSPQQISSLMDVGMQLYGSRPVAATITSISAMGLLAILVAELMVGVTVLQASGIDPLLALLGMSAALLVYGGFGGMRSVVTTDRWQVMLIIVALTFVVVSLFSRVATHVPDFVSGFLISGWTPRLTMPPALVANITIVNLCLLPASLRVWQVVAAAASGDAFRAALWESTLLILYTSFAALMIGKSMLILLSSENIQTEQIFQYLSTTGPFSGYVLYPLFVAALMSALVSTADSALMPLAQSSHLLFSSRFSHRLNLCIISAILAIGIGAYFMITRILNMGVVNWILTVFSITTVIAPAIVIPLFSDRRKLTRAGSIILIAGLIAGCAVAIAWSAAYSADIAMQPWNCVIGVAIATLAATVSIQFFSIPCEDFVTTCSD